MKCYADMNDVPVSDLLRQASIKTDNQLMAFMILVDNIFQTLAELQENKLYFIKLVQLTMLHMSQNQLLIQVKKMITIQHALQEWI